MKGSTFAGSVRGDREMPQAAMQSRPREPTPNVLVAACPSRVVLARVGEKWSAIVLVYLANGPVRFGVLRRKVEGISQKVLTQILRSLERDGLIVRYPQSGAVLRVEYSLTDLGRDLLPILQRLRIWAEEHVREILRNNARYDKRLERRSETPGDPVAASEPIAEDAPRAASSRSSAQPSRSSGNPGTRG
jgi:DNA-binding HxlR family transcriptional regulator